jgi:hypothetical protein
MRLIMRYLLTPATPCVKKGCSVLYKEDHGTPFRQAHCQNYLFLLRGYLIYSSIHLTSENSVKAKFAEFFFHASG